MLQSLLALLGLLLPFIKELFKNEDPLSKSINRNKLLIFFFIMYLGMFGTVIYLGDQSLNKQIEKRQCLDELEVLRKQTKPVQPQPPVIDVPLIEKPAISQPRPYTRRQPSPTPEPPKTLESKLDAIRKEEESQ